MAFYVLKDGHKLGPFSVEQVNAHLAGGNLEPTDHGWTEGFDSWRLLSQIEGFTMPEDTAAQSAEPKPQDTSESVHDSASALQTGADVVEAPGRRRWVWASMGALLIVCGVFGAYQLARGTIDLSSLCGVLVDINPPPEAEMIKEKPLYVQKYLEAAKNAEAGQTAYDALNEHLDLRSDHLTLKVDGLVEESEAWLKSVKDNNDTSPTGRAVVDLIRNVMLTNGLQHVDAMGRSSVAIKTNVHRHVAMVHRPPSAKGRMWKVLTNEAPSMDCLQLMPANTVLAFNARVDFSLWKPWLEEIAKTHKDEPWMVQLADTFNQLKAEIPFEELRDKWNGEAGVFLTLNPQKTFVADSAQGRIKIREPGFLLVFRMKDGELEKILAEQLKDQLVEEESVALSQGTKPILHVFQAPEMPAGLESLKLSPTLSQWGNYLLVASHKTLASATIKQAAASASGQMAPAEKLAQLFAKQRVFRNRIQYIPLPRANLFCFIAPRLDLWKGLASWQESQAPGIRRALVKLIGQSRDGGIHATAGVLPNGMLCKARVEGSSSGKTLNKISHVAHIFFAELVPQLAALAHRHWAQLELPSKPEPKPDPPEKTGS